MLILQQLKHRLVKDTLILFGVQITGYLLPLATLPYLTRVLGPENFGLLALGTALVLYFVVVIEYGFAITGPRQVAQRQTDLDGVSRYYSAVMACKLGLMLLSMLGLGLLLAMVPQYRQYWPLYALSFLQAVGWGFSPNWLLQGMQRMKFVAVADYGAKIVSVALIFIFVRQRSDYLLAAALQAGAYVVAASIGLAAVFLVLQVRLVRPSWNDMRGAMREGWPVFVSNASMTIVTSSNTMILGALASSAQVGFLNAATRLLIATRALMNPISSAVYPHMSKLVAESPTRALRFLHKQALWTALPFLGISVGLLGLAPSIVAILYGPEYAETVVLLRVMSLTPVLHAVGTCFCTYYMLAFGFEKAWSRIITAMMVLNFLVLTGLLQLVAPARAVAVTSVLMDVFVAAASVVFYRRTVGSSRVRALEREAGQNVQ